MLDGGPYRAPRPAEKRAVVRSTPQQQPDEPLLPDDEPRTVHRSAPHHAAPKEKFPKHLMLIVAAIITIIILFLAGWFAWSAMRPAAVAIDSSRYQAVFFTNGQVYFGKLTKFDNDYMKLTDVFYLQTKEAAESGSQNPQQTAKNSSSDVQLIKLGNEIHGPDDEMVISKDQVLFFENLKTDGKVAGSIEQYKKK